MCLSVVRDERYWESIRLGLGPVFVVVWYGIRGWVWCEDVVVVDGVLYTSFWCAWVFLFGLRDGGEIGMWKGGTRLWMLGHVGCGKCRPD